MTPLQLLVCCRIALGIASLTAPETFARAVGVQPTAATTYLSRIHRARAIGSMVALTGGYVDVGLRELVSRRNA